MQRSIIVVIGVALTSGACAVVQFSTSDHPKVTEGGDFAHRFAPVPPEATRPVSDYGSIRTLRPVHLP